MFFFTYLFFYLNGQTFFSSTTTHCTSSASTKQKNVCFDFVASFPKILNKKIEQRTRPFEQRLPLLISCDIPAMSAFLCAQAPCIKCKAAHFIIQIYNNYDEFFSLRVITKHKQKNVMQKVAENENKDQIGENKQQTTSEANHNRHQKYQRNLINPTYLTNELDFKIGCILI